MTPPAWRSRRHQPPGPGSGEGPPPGAPGSKRRAAAEHRRPTAMEWLAVVLAAGMEVAWLYPPLVLLGSVGRAGRPQPVIPLAAALGVVAAAAALSLTLSGSRLRPGLSRLVVAGGGLATAALVVRAVCFGDLPWLSFRWLPAMTEALGEFLLLAAPVRVAVAVGFLWWRGVSLGAEDLGPVEARGRLVSGGLGLAAGLFAAALLQRWGLAPGAAAAGGGSVLVFFSLALGLLATTNLNELARAGRTAASGLGRRARLRWAWMALGWGAALLATAVGLCAVVSPASVAALFAALRPVRTFLGAVLYYCFLPVGYLAWLVAGLISRLLGGRSWRDIFAQGPGMPQQPVLAGEGPALPWLLDAARWTAVALVVGLAALAFARAFVARRRRRLPASPGELRESVWSWARLASALGLRRRRGARPRPLPWLLPAALSPGVRRARALYRAVLKAAGRTGSPRRPAESPDEFHPRLSQLWLTWGGPQDRAASLTEAYNLARYGEKEPASGQLEAAEGAWHALANRVPAGRRHRPRLGRRPAKPAKDAGP